MVVQFSPENPPSWFQDKEAFVLPEGRRIVATGSLVGNRIMTVFVDPDRHGQGYGKRVMTYLEQMARERGHPKVVLNSSLSSKEFYLGLGYQELAGVFDETGGDMIAMEKRL